MTNAIFEILQKNYGSLGQNVTSAREIAEMMKEFIEWKDKEVEYCKNGKSPHYRQYYLKTDGHYIEGYNNLWLQLPEIFTYWKDNVYNKQ